MLAAGMGDRTSSHQWEERGEAGSSRDHADALRPPSAAGQQSYDLCAVSAAVQSFKNRSRLHTDACRRKTSWLHAPPVGVIVARACGLCNHSMRVRC